MTSAICIGGSLHGRMVPIDGRTRIEVEFPYPVQWHRPPLAIDVPMNRFQRFIARLFGIPTTVQRPVERLPRVTESYELRRFRDGPVMIFVFAREGLKLTDKQLAQEVCVLADRDAWDVRCESPVAGTGQIGPVA